MTIQSLLIKLGIVLLVLGLAWPWLERLGLGRLPGDILIEREKFKEPLINSSRLSGPCSVQLQGAVRREGWLPLQARQRRRWALQGPPSGALPESQPLRCAFSPYFNTLSKPRLDADFLAKPEARRIDQRFLNVYVPVTSALLVSLVLSLLVWLWRR